VAYAAIVMRLQVAVLYFHAAVAKFGVTDWADPTAMYHWFNHRTFGAAPWLPGHETRRRQFGRGGRRDVWIDRA
jgi:hypothetical protein